MRPLIDSCTSWFSGPAPIPPPNTRMVGFWSKEKRARASFFILSLSLDNAKMALRTGHAMRAERMGKGNRDQNCERDESTRRFAKPILTSSCNASVGIRRNHAAHKRGTEIKLPAETIATGFADKRRKTD